MAHHIAQSIQLLNAHQIIISIAVQIGAALRFVQNQPLAFQPGFFVGRIEGGKARRISGRAPVGQDAQAAAFHHLQLGFACGIGDEVVFAKAHKEIMVVGQPF